MKTLNPYLTFRGNCEEAFRFYETVLGGKIVALVRYGDTPAQDQVPPEFRDKIIHTHLVAGEAMLMGSDAPPGRQSAMHGFSVNVWADTPAEAERIFNALAEGGTAHVPMAETFFAHRFGMLRDRYDTPWMVNCVKVPN